MNRDLDVAPQSMTSHQPGALRLTLFSALLFALCLTLYTRENNFPFFYHPDEPNKTRQVIQGDWNFHHPMLLLTTAKVVTDLFGVPKDDQHIVVAGRWIS